MASQPSTYPPVTEHQPQNKALIIKGLRRETND